MHHIHIYIYIYAFHVGGGRPEPGAARQGGRQARRGRAEVSNLYNMYTYIYIYVYKDLPIHPSRIDRGYNTRALPTRRDPPPMSCCDAQSQTSVQLSLTRTNHEHTSHMSKTIIYIYI